MVTGKPKNKTNTSIWERYTKKTRKNSEHKNSSTQERLLLGMTKEVRVREDIHNPL
jgi:hypothetical protein